MLNTVAVINRDASELRLVRRVAAPEIHLLPGDADRIPWIES
jgi:hypothetical protein